MSLVGDVVMATGRSVNLDVDFRHVIAIRLRQCRCSCRVSIVYRLQLTQSLGILRLTRREGRCGLSTSDDGYRSCRLRSRGVRPRCAHVSITRP